VHLYQAEMEDRRRVFWLLATAATAASFGIGILIHAVFSDPPRTLGPPSGAVLFGLLYVAYDRWFWRIGIGPLRLSQIPRLGGSWTGDITIKDKAGAAAPYPCLVQIKQTWLRMSVVFYSPISKSTSSSGTLRSPPADIGDFRYEYHVMPEGKGGTKMVKHDGLARLWIVDDWSDMRGNFFNDESFQKFGDYNMKKSPKRIKTEDWLVANRV
jgi:hypothetical protein